MEPTNKETIINKQAANLLRGIEHVGGSLTLTNTQLIFSPHIFNVQSNSEIIELKDIISCEKIMSKFLGILPIIPNSIRVITNNKVFDFVVFRRARLIELIDQARNALNG